MDPILNYDEYSDVLRVRWDSWEHAVGVPMEGVTAMLDEETDELLGFEFLVYLPEIGDPEERRRQFEKNRVGILSIVPGMAEALRPMAKDRLAYWAELVSTDSRPD